MTKRFAWLLILVAIFLFGKDPPLSSESIPTRIEGVELATLKGWHANIYPWTYIPEWSTVHPVPSLWDPPKWDSREQRYVPQQQSWTQIDRQSRQLEEYGSGADVLEFNVAPGNQDYNHWLRTYLGDNSDRPFYVLYEHIHGNTNYVETNGAKNMNLFQNKKAFVDDIEFFLNNVVLPNKHRYVTVNGRAVIYLWAPTIMNGDFASLLLAIKLKYPVFFIGSSGIMGGTPTDPQVLKNLRALDGFMEYANVIFDTDPNGVPKPDNYLTMIGKYNAVSVELRQLIRRFESQTGHKYLFIPTFQAAYDDTNFPDRDGGISMYSRTRFEMEHSAEVIKRGMGTIYDNIGPFVVYSELPEGGAVIESQCLPQTLDRSGRFVGCGTRRLQIVKKYFGK